MQKVIAKIHLGNILRNAKAFKAYASTKLCAVVKADAYGHGGEEVVAALEGVADFFAVALIEEGVAVRAAACGKDILALTPPITEAECLSIAVNGFLASIPDLYTARLFAQTVEKYRLQGRVHLKVNTGMNRYGMNGSMLGKVCRFFQAKPFISVEGIYSHLYQTNLQTATEQKEKFDQAVGICRRYFPNALAHLSATYGGLLGKAFAYDCVRIGLGLYGYAPMKAPFPLYKGMEVETRVISSRKYAYGGVGYGEIEPLKKGEKLSLCRVGYADGFLRRRENGISGKNANNLCMDACIQYGGKRRGQVIPIMTDADETAREAGTIPYEVLCAATRRAERVYDYE